MRQDLVCVYLECTLKQYKQTFNVLFLSIKQVAEMLWTIVSLTVLTALAEGQGMG